LPTESRMVWKEVTELIHAKEFSRATKVKQNIEAKQRRDAALRNERNQEWVPKYFVRDAIGGRADLTREGREMLETVYAA
jgi:oxysterol-binding protein-related protein 9/10/11